MDIEKIKEANRHLNDVEQKSGTLFLRSKPRNVSLDLIGKCSLACTHCGVHVHGLTSGTEMSDDTYELIVSELFPTTEVCSLGGGNYGEVTLAKKFHRVVNDCERNGISISLTTNGTIVNSSWLSDLVRNVSVVGFSLEGMESEYEKIRGFKWSSYLKNIEKVIGERERQGRSFPVEWRYCAHSDSISQLPDMIRRAKSMNIDRVRVMPFFPYVQSQKYKQLFYHRSAANSVFSESRAVARELGVEVSIPADFSTGTFELNQCEKAKEVTSHSGQCTVVMKKCEKPWKNMTLNELGDIRACHILWRRMGRAYGRAGRSVHGVWNSLPYLLLRATVNRCSSNLCYRCRQPSFEGESSTANTSLLPGRKEILQSFFTPRPKVSYIDCPA